MPLPGPANEIAKIDRVSNLYAREVHGVVVELGRLAVVTGIRYRDYSVLMKALDNIGIPVYGSRVSIGVPLADGDPDKTLDHLILVQRNPKIINDDYGTVEIELIYKTPMEGDHQDLDLGDQKGVVYGRMTAAIHQTKTNFFYPNGDHTKPKETIYVGHIFAKNDPYGRAGKFAIQGGEVTVAQPQKNFKFSGIKDTKTPWFVANRLIACVNEKKFLGDNPKEWMITSIEWEPIGIMGLTQRTRYQFRYELQHNPDTWDPTAVFSDHQTHRPPPGLSKVDIPLPGGLIIPAGVKEIPYHKPLDFEKEFGVKFEGS
jgi:hypothetical protein